MSKDYLKKFKNYILSDYNTLPKKVYESFVKDDVLNIDDKDIVLHYNTFLLINNISLDEFERVTLANNLKKEDVYYNFLNNNNNNDVIINYSRISKDVFLDLCLFIKDEDSVNKLTKVFDFYAKNSYIKYFYEMHYDKINANTLYSMINQHEIIATLTDLCLIRNKLKNNYVNEVITTLINQIDSNNRNLFVIKNLEKNLVLREQELLNNVVHKNNIQHVKKL